MRSKKRVAYELNLSEQEVAIIVGALALSLPKNIKDKARACFPHLPDIDCDDISKFQCDLVALTEE